MRFSEAKSSAEAEGTEKAKRFRKTARRAIVAITVFVILVPITYMVADWKKTSETETARQEAPSSIPLASKLAVAERPKLVMPPRGRSEEIPRAPGMRIVMDGDNFRLHNVYQDGTECASEDACPDGPLRGVYATNESDKENIVAWAYVE
ncbi:MAG: hypothetical protein WC798_01300 [Candidatus Paceibacterota bacterium]|jgi:hypothetical protein